MRGPFAAWRILIAAVACLGPTLKYGLMAYDETLISAAMKSVEFFSYFTILSNMLAAAALTAPLVAPASRFAAWAEQSGPRAAIATYACDARVAPTSYASLEPAARARRHAGRDDSRCQYPTTLRWCAMSAKRSAIITV